MATSDPKVDFIREEFVVGEFCKDLACNTSFATLVPLRFLLR